MCVCLSVSQFVKWFSALFYSTKWNSACAVWYLRKFPCQNCHLNSISSFVAYFSQWIAAITNFHSILPVNYGINFSATVESILRMHVCAVKGITLQISLSSITLRCSSVNCWWQKCFVCLSHINFMARQIRSLDTSLEHCLCSYFHILQWISM